MEDYRFSEYKDELNCTIISMDVKFNNLFKSELKTNCFYD